VFAGCGRTLLSPVTPVGVACLPAVDVRSYRLSHLLLWS